MAAAIDVKDGPPPPAAPPADANPPGPTCCCGRVSDPCQQCFQEQYDGLVPFYSIEDERNEAKHARSQWAFILCVFAIWYCALVGIRYGFGSNQRYSTRLGFGPNPGYSILFSCLMPGCWLFGLLFRFRESRLIVCPLFAFSAAVLGATVPLSMGVQIYSFSHSLGEPYPVYNVYDIPNLPRVRPFSVADGPCEDQTRLYEHQRIRLIGARQNARLFTKYEFIHSYEGFKQIVHTWQLLPLIAASADPSAVDGSGSKPLIPVDQLIATARLNSSYSPPNQPLSYTDYNSSALLIWLNNYDAWYERPEQPDRGSPVIPVHVGINSDDMILTYSHVARDHDEVLLACDPYEFDLPNVLNHRDQLIVLDGRDWDAKAAHVFRIGFWMSVALWTCGVWYLIGFIRWSPTYKQLQPPQPPPAPQQRRVSAARPIAPAPAPAVAPAVVIGIVPGSSQAPAPAPPPKSEIALASLPPQPVVHVQPNLNPNPNPNPLIPDPPLPAPAPVPVVVDIPNALAPLHPNHPPPPPES